MQGSAAASLTGWSRDTVDALYNELCEEKAATSVVSMYVINGCLLEELLLWFIPRCSRYRMRPLWLHEDQYLPVRDVVLELSPPKGGSEIDSVVISDVD